MEIFREIQHKLRRNRKPSEEGLPLQIETKRERKLFSDEARFGLDKDGNIFYSLPRKSTTLDNGKENHNHFELNIELDMLIYFADPYSSWQRGTNEHGNWHIRYYFPKGTDFAKVSNEELQDVIWEINNRPRKILGYQTAEEVFTNLLNQEKGGVGILDNGSVCNRLASAILRGLYVIRYKHPFTCKESRN